MYHLMKHNPSYLAELGCACQEMGMVTPANVATLGSAELGRSTYSYDRAIARVKAKIAKLKKVKKLAKLKARKAIIQRQIVNQQQKLAKLQAYRKIRAKKIADKTGADDMIAGDEDILLQESMIAEPITEQEIAMDSAFEAQPEMDWMKIGLIALGIGGALFLARGMFGGSKVRTNRLKLGKKANPKKRKNPTKKIKGIAKKANPKKHKAVAKKIKVIAKKANPKKLVVRKNKR